MVEVPGPRHVVLRAGHDIELGERRDGLDGVIDRARFIHAEPAVEEPEERGALAVGVRVDEILVGLHRWIGHRARRVPDLPAEVRPLEIAVDPFERDEQERLVFLERATERAAPLLAVELVERAPVRELARELLVPLKIEQASVRLVRAGLGDDVDHASRGAPEFRRGARRNHLELLHRLERDVNRRALAPRLLAEEPVVVVPAVEADVVEHAALSRKRDLVAVRPLDDADAGREREQILELAAEDRRGLDRQLVQRVRRRRAGRVDDLRGRRDRHRFGDARHFHRNRQGDRLPDRQRARSAAAWSQTRRGRS